MIHKNDSPCSIDLSRNAKGQPSWSIKLYGNRDEMDTVLDEVLGLDKRLQKETQDHDG